MKKQTHNNNNNNNNNSQHEHKKKPYVGDYGQPIASKANKTKVTIWMVLFALIIGLIIGFLVWGIYLLSSFLTSLLWDNAYGPFKELLENTGISSWWIPVAICTIGGLIIGLITKFFGGQPKELSDVMGEVKKTGTYKLEKPVASVFGFLLPLVFGGSIGPEAGLTGIIAASCSAIGNALKKAGLRVKQVTNMTISATISAVFGTPFAGLVTTSYSEFSNNETEKIEAHQEPNPQDYQLKRSGKIVLYTAAAFGAVCGLSLVNRIFPPEAGLPHFDGITPALADLWWAIPCIALGYLCALLYHSSNICFARLGERLESYVVLKPVITGVILGTLAIWFPYVLFPGESQSHELMQTWSGIGAPILVATGMLKCVVSPLCLNMGWKGGHFFPLIFAGIIAGYGIAAISGIDPMFCVAMTTGSLIAGVQRNAIIAMAMLLLCFPISSIIFMGIGCLIVAALPFPTDKKKRD